MAVVGVIPAAGKATRLQPLPCSKEVYPIHGRPVIDYLVERMREAGCTQVRVVTRPDKRDVVEYARQEGTTAIEANPPSPAASLLAGMRGLARDDVVLLGYPDSIWQPVDGFKRLTRLIADGYEIALGLFHTSWVDRPDVVVLDDSEGTVVSIDVSSESAPPQLIWACAAARARALRDLRDYDDPGEYFSVLCRSLPIAGALLSNSYVDMGTKRGLREALGSPAARA